MPKSPQFLPKQDMPKNPLDTPENADKRTKIAFELLSTYDKHFLIVFSH